MDLVIVSERLFIAEALADLLVADDRVATCVVACDGPALWNAILRTSSYRLVADLDRLPLPPAELGDRLGGAPPDRRIGVYDVFTPQKAHLAFELGITVLAPLSMRVEDLCATILEDQRASRVTVAEGVDRGALLKLSSLTPRETEVLGHLVRGMAVNDVSDALSITAHTVQTHKRRIFTKLGVQSQAQAVTLALSAGLARSAENHVGETLEIGL